MRYHIDTIPVLDAYKTDCECPLCHIAQQNEAMYVDNFLGASVMEPDVRVAVNKQGFCAHHYGQMIMAKNRLGLALMTHTHLKEVIARFEDNASQLDAARNTAGTSGLSRLFGKTAGPGKEQAQAVSRAMAHDVQDCILCTRLAHTMDRYCYTVLHLWKTELDFRALFDKSKGLCMAHFARMVDMATQTLDGAQCNAFLAALISLQKQALARIEKELEWFTLKFDYRNHDKPWGNARDALERAINKLESACVGENPFKAGT